MADIAAFPTMRNILVSGDNIQSFTAGAAITAGQVVAIHGTGVTRTVHPGVTGTTGYAAGVALYTVASGAEVAVACRGCIVKVANGESDATADAGDPLAVYGTTTAGTVTALALTGGITPTMIVGYALGDLAASGQCDCEIAPGYITPAA